LPAANPEHALRCCWNRSRYAIKLRSWNANRTRRPCFRRFDRLFWILPLHASGRKGRKLVIVKRETVFRWRRTSMIGALEISIMRSLAR